jgi:hypothetical protein
MPRITNPKTTVIAVPATGQVLISATKNCKYAEIVECPPATFNDGSIPFAPQGLLYTLPDDNYTAEYALLPAQTWAGGDNTYRGKLGFAFQGATDPAGQTIPATPYMKVASSSGVATQIRLTEWS